MKTMVSSKVFEITGTIGSLILIFFQNIRTNGTSVFKIKEPHNTSLFAVLSSN
jgi:hypothetical protein